MKREKHLRKLIRKFKMAGTTPTAHSLRSAMPHMKVPAQKSLNSMLHQGR
jgi:hypothetical protein